MTASGRAASAISTSGRTGAMATAMTKGSSAQAAYSSRVRCVAGHHGQRPLARRRISRDIAQVIDDEQRAGEQPDRHGSRQGQPGHPVHLHVGSAGHRGHAEEKEDGDLAERAVAVRPVSAGVEPRGRDSQAAEQDQPPRGHQREHQPGHAGGGEAAQRGREHLPGPGQTGTDQPDRADPFFVGAAYAVAVVVRIVDAHLQGQGHEQREYRAPQLQLPVANRDARAHHDGHDRRRKRPRAGTSHPVPCSGHGPPFVV